MKPLQGEISILVKPFGSIHINDELKAKERQFIYKEKINVGTVKFLLKHSYFGEWSKQVEIAESKVTKISVDFNDVGTLIVTTQLADGKPTQADNIQIDGEWKNVSTPKSFAIRIGRHRVWVRKQGYQVQGGPKTINIEKGEKYKLEFIFTNGV